MSSQWWPAKESWWSHRTASRRGADCRTAKLGLKLGSSHRMAIYSQILWRTIGFGGIYLFSDNHVGSMAETCWNMLKHAETDPWQACHHFCAVTSSEYACKWLGPSIAADRLQLRGLQILHGKSSVFLCHFSDAPVKQPRMMLSYVCLHLSHSKNGKTSVISGRRLQPITFWIRQLAAEDEPLKAPSCPQSEEAAASVGFVWQPWPRLLHWWLPSFWSGMTHDDDSWHNDS